MRKVPNRTHSTVQLVSDCCLPAQPGTCRQRVVAAVSRPQICPSTRLVNCSILHLSSWSSFWGQVYSGFRRCFSTVLPAASKYSTGGICFSTSGKSQRKRWNPHPLKRLPGVKTQIAAIGHRQLRLLLRRILRLHPKGSAPPPAVRQALRTDWIERIPGAGLKWKCQGDIPRPVIDETYRKTEPVAERNLGPFAGWPAANHWLCGAGPGIMRCSTYRGARVTYFLSDACIPYSRETCPWHRGPLARSRFLLTRLLTYCSRR